MVQSRLNERYAWLESTAVRRVSDLALGGVLIAAAMAAFLGTRDLAPGWETGARLLPSLLAGLMAGIAALLLARAALSSAPVVRWPAWQLWLVAGLILLAVALNVATVIGVVHGLTFRPP